MSGSPYRHHRSEMALLGVPTVVSGRAHYRGKGFMIDVASPDDHRVALDKLLDDPASMPIDLDAARRYADPSLSARRLHLRLLEPCARHRPARGAHRRRLPGAHRRSTV